MVTMKSSLNKNIWRYAVENAKENLRFTTDSGMHNFLKIFYYLALAYTLFINLVVILGHTMNIQYLSAIAEPTSAQVTNLLAAKNLLALAAGTVILYIIGAFLLSKQKVIAFLIINVLSSAVLFVSFRLSMSDSILSDGPLKFWVRHGIPLTVMIVFSVFMFLICFFENHKRKAEYNRLMNGLYIYFSQRDENVVNNSDFEEYLNSYDGFQVKGNMDKPLKRSEKIRQRKHESENEKM